MGENKSGAFSDAELQAMRERAEELRAEKGGKKKADRVQALLDTAESLPAPERELVLTVHKLVGEIAPELDGRTWYGMPAWEKDGAVLLFVQHASKFGVRYSTLGFNDNAALDDGDMWPTSFAVPSLTPAVTDRIRALIASAMGR